MLLERSINIVLSEEPPEPATAEAVLVPLSSKESLIASMGLGKYINMLYRAVQRDSDDERALKSVYDLITEDVEDFRTRAMNLAVGLNPERAQQESRAIAALAISHLIVGQKSHRNGVWLIKRAKEMQLMERFKEVMGSDELSFFELNEWAIKQTSRNDRYWRQGLQAVRSHPIITELRDRIEASDHEAEV